MKYLKDINESFFVPKPILDTGNHQFFGDRVDESYSESVSEKCLQIAMDDMQISEKAFDMIDRLSHVCKKTIAERRQEFDAIVHNCKHRNFRPQYTAETVYHTILQGKLKTLQDRPVHLGGFLI